LELDAAGLGPIAEDFADGIGERGDLADAVGHVGDAFFVQAKAVDRGFREAVLFSFGDIGGVGLEDVGKADDQLVGHRHEDGVLGFRIKPGEGAGGGAGVFSDLVDLILKTAHDAMGV
jgi:hypothetical protein